MLSQEFRNARSQHDPKWVQKIAIRGAQVFIAILSLFIAASVHNNGIDAYSAEPYLGGIFLMYVIAWLGTTFWAIANLIYLRLRITPLHPGFAVGLDLIAWLWYGLISFASYSAFQVVLKNKATCNDPSVQNLLNQPNSTAEYINTNCQFPQYSTYLSALIFMAFGGTAIALMHLYLFVRACIDTNHRRASRRQNMQNMQNMQPNPAYNANFSYGGQKA